MPEQFIHGIEIVEIDDGIRPIQTAKSSVIGLVGTASKGPLNTPVLIAGSRKEAVTIFGEQDATSTIPEALDAILDQTGAMVVVIRVPAGASAAETKTAILGGVDAATGEYTGVHALFAAGPELGLNPKIIVAPGFTNDADVMAELVGIAEKLRAVIIADGPGTTDAAAITYRESFGSSRVYLVDPRVKVYDTVQSKVVSKTASARVAGLIAKTDNEKGFWFSPSNQTINGISGTSRPVDFRLGDQSCRANYLNDHQVATIVNMTGFRLWGNQTCSSDPKWKFLSVRRTADMIHESLMEAHLWAIDRNITRTYIDDVLEGVNAYLRHLKAVGAILGGKCYADPELNTPEQISLGKVYFDFDFTPPYPAEHISFRSHLVNDYIKEVLK